MEFDGAIKIVCSALEATGTHVSKGDYDGVAVKKLVSSNTLDTGRTTNQTHIAITGNQMDIFPYLRSEGYFTGNDDVSGDELKKYFIGKVPVDLFETNIEYLNGGEPTDIVFVDGKRRTNTSIIRSKRQNQSDQIQMSLLSFDGPDFVRFRRLLHNGTFLIMLKRKSTFLYEFFGIIPKLGTKEATSLQEINNKLFIKSTSTMVDINKLVYSDDTEKIITKNAVGGFNKIYYGAPGCGKSRYISDLLRSSQVDENRIIRVTFHPEYSNIDFVGQILPTIETNKNGEDVVRYIFNPGPFSIALLKAYNTNDMVYLIIEEINRGNAAAIFGDMFQLLDRIRDDDSLKYCASEYPVNNPNMQKYLLDRISKEDIKRQVEEGIYIPGNLTIFATMNSSDQNVFPLDTAFKRRWEFEQISNNIEQDHTHAYKNWYIPGTETTWAHFLTKLNDKILEYGIYSQTNEDKRLGKYFVTQDCLTEEIHDIADVRDIAKAFAYKVLEYIWSDVCKIGREDWFDTSRYKTLEQLIDAFIKPATGDTPLSIFQNIIF